MIASKVWLFKIKTRSESGQLIKMNKSPIDNSHKMWWARYPTSNQRVINRQQELRIYQKKLQVWKTSRISLSQASRTKTRSKEKIKNCFNNLKACRDKWWTLFKINHKRLHKLTKILTIMTMSCRTRWLKACFKKQIKWAFSR